MHSVQENHRSEQVWRLKLRKYEKSWQSFEEKNETMMKKNIYKRQQKSPLITWSKK